jgi:hypothetical protein
MLGATVSKQRLAKEPFTTSSGLQTQRTSDLSSLAGYNTRSRGRILSSLADEEVVKCFSKRLRAGKSEAAWRSICFKERGCVAGSDS